MPARFGHAVQAAGVSTVFLYGGMGCKKYDTVIVGDKERVAVYSACCTRRCVGVRCSQGFWLGRTPFLSLRRAQGFQGWVCRRAFYPTVTAASSCSVARRSSMFELSSIKSHHDQQMLRLRFAASSSVRGKHRAQNCKICGSASMPGCTTTRTCCSLADSLAIPCRVRS
eukprot:30750_4